MSPHSRGTLSCASWLQSESFKLRVFFGISALKLLLVPAYRSTDFEVHRNWLAITGSLPINQWYLDSTSEWTLDYPPLFAWFEWLLAQIARLVDPAMLQVNNLNYDSAATIAFQRGSVIVADLVLASGALYAVRRLSRSHGNIVFFLILANPGLLIVDHIHFQYNGFLLGILIWSLGLIIEGKDLAGGLLFAVLVNMKHLYAVLGPAYFVYLLQHHCRGERAFYKFITLAAGVLSVFGLSFGPFIELGQMKQLLSRLFPFERGLCHAYWAANVWALYALLDKVLVAVLSFVDIPVEAGVANMTGGLVGQMRFTVMPDIPAAIPLAMVVLSILPSLYTLWQNPNAIIFVRSITYCALCSFMLGYHVHEKAVLGVSIPAALTAVASRRSAGEYLFLVILSTYALFPLLQGMAEYPVKLLQIGTKQPADDQKDQDDPKPSKSQERPRAGLTDDSAMLSPLEVLYLTGLIAVEIYSTFLHHWILHDRLPFLPLMLISTYCAAGMVWLWAQPDVVEVVTPMQVTES